MSQVIVTTREELAAIVDLAVRKGMDAALRGMARQQPGDSLTPQQAAEYLCQSPNTLRQWRCQGRGPAYEKRGRNIRYKREDLESWRAANRVVTAEALESVTPRHSARHHLSPEAYHV